MVGQVGSSAGAWGSGSTLPPSDSARGADKGTGGGLRPLGIPARCVVDPWATGQLLATVLLGFVWAMWHLPLALVDPRFAHGFPGGSPEGNLRGALGRGGVSLLHAVVVLVFATGGVVLAVVLIVVVAADIAVLSQR